MDEVKRNRIDSIQGLRAFAALAVVFYHSVIAVARSYEEGVVSASVVDFAQLGNFGVDVFFVISGFIMIYSHQDDFGVVGAQKRFLLNRIKRIVPNYWLLTTVGVLILVLAPSLSHHGRTADPAWVLASYFFIPYTSSAGIPLPVLGLGWTLNYEMYFYLIFSFSLLFSRSLGLFLLALLFISSAFLGLFVSVESPFLKQATSWLLIEFLAGVLLGNAFKRGVSVSLKVGFFMLLISIPILIFSFDFREGGALSDFSRFIFYGVPAILIASAAVLSARIREVWMPKSIILMGNASYSLYLTHVFTLPLAWKIIQYLEMGGGFFASVLALVLSSIIVSIAFYWLFEKPAQRLLRPIQFSKAP